MKGVIVKGGMAGLLAVVAFAGAAHALTRPEYVAQADAICKAANKRSAKAIRPLQKRFGHFTPPKKGDSKKQAIHKTKRLFRFFGVLYIRIGKVRGHAMDQIRTLPLPPEDAAVLSAWVGLEYEIVGDYYDIGRSFKAFHLDRANEAAKALAADRKAADRQVAGFGFHRCAGKPPKQSGPAL